MIIDHVILGRVISLVKYLSSAVSLIFPAKKYFLKKIAFPVPNSLDLTEPVENEIRKTFSKKYLPLLHFRSL